MDLLMLQVLQQYQPYYSHYKLKIMSFYQMMYGGTFRLTERILNRFNIKFTTVNATHPEEIEQAIQPNTKLIYIETPSNPCFKITDIKAVAHIAKSTIYF